MPTITALLALPSSRFFTAYPFVTDEGDLHGFTGSQLRPMSDELVDAAVAEGQARRLRRAARWKSDGSAGLAASYAGRPRVERIPDERPLIALWLGRTFEAAARKEGLDAWVDLRSREDAVFVASVEPDQSEPQEGILCVMPLQEAKAWLDAFIDRAFEIVQAGASSPPGSEPHSAALRLTGMMTACRPDHPKTLSAQWHMTPDEHRGTLLQQHVQENMQLVSERWVAMLEQTWGVSCEHGNGRLAILEALP